MITNKEYRDYPAIHYSLLSKIAKDPSSVKSEEKDFSDGLMFGDALDILLIQGQEEFDKKYIVARVEKPTGQMGDFIDELLRLKDKSLAYQSVGFKRDSIDKVLVRFETEGKEYYDFIIDTKDKIIISAEMMMKVRQAVHTLKNHPFTKDYFGQLSSNNYHYLTQHPILFKIGDKECKALLDIVIIDHIKKIIQPIDLKSTGDYITSFPASFVKWRYDLQAAFYTEALKQEYPDYEIKPFKFIVISSQQLNKPLIYRCTDNDLLVGRKGGLNTYSNRRVKGWEQLIDDYIWHLENDLWDYPREVYEQNGEVDLDVFKYEFEKKVYEGKKCEEE